MEYYSKNSKINKEENWMQRMQSYQYKQADLNRFVMNYLITEGYKDAAETFELEAKLEPSLKMLNPEERMRVHSAVKEGQVEKAVEIAHKLYPILLGSDNYIYFHMQQLQLIELIHERKLQQALTLAQNKSSGLSDVGRENIHEMERTLALLAFQKPEERPFSDLMQQGHRQKMASELNSAILKYNNTEETKPKLMFLIKLILWAQGKLDSRYQKVDLESDDFEEEFRQMLEGP